MISKELLSEVFGVDIKDDPKIGFAYDDVNGIELEWKEVRFNFISYPLDYVAHKCKEWAYINGNLIMSGLFVFEGHKDGVAHIDGMQKWYAPTEPEAIFKACQWILDNK